MRVLAARFSFCSPCFALLRFELDPRLVLALGLKEIGENAQKVGTLMITSEVLAALLNAPQIAPNANASTREDQANDDAPTFEN